MMNENKILIGIIVVASCMLVLLYSPWGSPGNYIENDSYGFKTGVNFSSRIENAPREVFSSSSGYSESPVPYAESGYLELRSLNTSAVVSAPDNHIAANYKVNSQVKSSKIAVVSSNSGFVPSAVYNVTKALSKNNNNANSTSISVLGLVSFSSARNSSNVNNVSNATNLANISNLSNLSKNSEDDDNKKQGFATLTTELNPTDGSLLASGPMKLDGVSTPGDPGTLETAIGTPGDEPIGDPIPVGDGFWILLVLLVGYAGWKLKAVEMTI